MHIDESIVFKGDEGDLMEIVGNLLDNAFKWASSQIVISAHSITIPVTTPGKTSPGLTKLKIHISDDGPGIPPDQVEKLRQRGMRADQSTDGHGIGLSIVGNIIDAYNGELSITKSSLGGTEVTILL